MHEEWQELIPYYVAGSLSDEEARALHLHLQSCSICHQELEQWQMVRDVVQNELDLSPKNLPPLRLTSPNGTGHIHDDMLVIRPHPQKKKTFSLSLPLVASAVMTFIVISLLIYAGSDDDTARMQAVPIYHHSPTPSQTPTSTPVAVGLTREASHTPICAENCTTPTLDAGASCLITNPQANPINLYAGPGESYTILSQIAEFGNAAALARSDSGWYRVRYTQESSIWVGWVKQADAELYGSCDYLTVIPMIQQTASP